MRGAQKARELIWSVVASQPADNSNDIHSDNGPHTDETSEVQQVPRFHSFLQTNPLGIEWPSSRTTAVFQLPRHDVFLRHHRYAAQRCFNRDLATGNCTIERRAYYAEFATGDGDPIKIDCI